VLSAWGENNGITRFSCGSILSKEISAMNVNDGSIFDLTPPENLQLAEDLWDDLASTSEAVSLQDWQKDELARRKANLLNTPSSWLS